MNDESTLPGATTQRRSLARIVVVLVLSSLLQGCWETTPPDWNVLMKDDPVAQAKQERTETAPKTSDALIVYLDTSKSMAGYLLLDRQKPTVFSRTLQELRNLSTIITPPLDVYVRRVSAEVSEPLNETFLSEASNNQRVYDGNETNLSGAIERFARVEKRPATESIVATKAEGGPESDAEEPKPLPPARFHILITDGVQSTKQSSDAVCTNGSDQICVRKKILGLLNQGWGGYIVGLRSEFKGKVYSEISHGVISFETKRGSWQSHRPFYLYVFSPDQAALDQLVLALQERLRPLLSDPEAIRSLALTSSYADGWGRGDLEIAKEPGNPLVAAGVPDQNPSRLTLKVSLETEKGAPRPFSLRSRINWTTSVSNSGTAQELASLVKWDLRPIYPSAAATTKGTRLPEVTLVAAQPQPDGTIKIDLTAQWPRATGTPQWRAYRLEGRLNLTQQTPVWIKQWSTDLDTSVEAANRTLFLESALLGLWHNSKLEKQIVAEMYLRVGPK
jgi:hypothetical protein